MVTNITKDMIDGLDDADKCEAYRQVLINVYKAIGYEKGKDPSDALNKGLTIILDAIPEADRH